MLNRNQVFPPLEPLPPVTGLLSITNPIKMHLAANKDRAAGDSHRRQRSRVKLVLRQGLELLAWGNHD